MNQTEFDRMFDQLERRFLALSGAIVSGEVGAIELHSYGLQQLARELPACLQRLQFEGTSQTQLKLKFKTMAERIHTQREAVLRRSLSIERSLNVLLPTRQDPHSYSPRAARYRATGSAKYQLA